MPDDKSYIVGWNISGCLPEMEPFEIVGFEEAKGAMIEELRLQEENYLEEILLQEAEDFHNTVEDVRTWTGPDTTGEQPDGYVYWIVDAEN